MIGSAIVFPRLLPFNMPEGMSVQSLLESSGHKIVAYVDSSGCEDCNIYNAIGIRGYELALKHKQRDDIPFIYIFNTQDIGALQDRLRQQGFYRYYFVDIENTFLEKNRIPANQLFHTFLLKDGRVQVIGNPSTNQKIRDLYDKVLGLK